MSDLPAKQPKSERDAPDLDQTAVLRQNGKLKKKLHPNNGVERRAEGHHDNGIRGAEDDDLYRGAAHFYRQRNHETWEDIRRSGTFETVTTEGTCNGFLEEGPEGVQVAEKGARPVAQHLSDNEADGLVSWHYVNGYGGHPNSPEDGVGAVKSGDDMESYFNANAHLLAYLDQQSRSINYECEAPVSKETSSSSRSKDNQDHVNLVGSMPCNGYVTGGARTSNGAMRQLYTEQSRSARLSTDSDQVDFIETDISLQQSTSGSYGTLHDYSEDEEDLPVLAPYGQCSSAQGQVVHSTFLHGQSDLRTTASQDKCKSKCSDSCQIHGHGGVGKKRTFRQPKGCDYKRMQADASSPATFNSASKHCQCSVVSYSRGRPVAQSNSNDPMSESDDPLHDEGLDLQSSPLEVSPVESDSGAPCGITVTSDSASYLSPEDVDFTDFDTEPDGATPPDQVCERETNTRTGDAATGAIVNSVNGCTFRKGVKWTCADCGNEVHSCLCASLQACKRLLEGSQCVTAAFSDRAGASSFQLSNAARDDHGLRENGAYLFCADMPGRDSGSGSQEHLDSLSCSDDPNDHTPPLQTNQMCMCRSHTYTGYEAPGDRARSGGLGEAYSEDTNNLDVEAFSAAPSSDYEDELFNVSRQTSTSNFDQDENTYQDAVEDLTSNGFHSACSGSDLEEKSNHHSNQDEAARSDGYPSKTPEVLPNHKVPSGGHSPGRSVDFNREMPVHHAGSGARERPGEGTSWRDQGVGRQVAWPTMSDDESSIAAVQWPEYDFQSEEADLNRRRPLARPSWLHLSDDDSPVNTVRLLEHGFVSPAISSDPDDNRQAGTSPEQLGYDDHYAMRSPPPLPPPPPAQSRDEDQHTRDMEPNFPDPLTDIFILNLLREKESRALSGGAPSRTSVEKVMIWSEYEAYVLQVKQIGASACGATAVINVLKAFDIYVDKAAVVEAIVTNRRDETAPVAEYLLSRSTAGCTADHLTEGVERLTGGEIIGRFFGFFPERDVDICHWLGTWIKKGAVPLLTLNLQKAVPQGWDTPDAWHHQMAYGVGPKGVYLTNPLEMVPEEVIREQLTSDAVLLVLRQDVISRWSTDSNLGLLLHQTDERWRHMNVLGQVVNVLREANMPRVLGFRPQLTTHVRIPSWYQPGVSLFVRRNSDAYQELMAAPDLPIKHDPVPASPGGSEQEESTVEESPTDRCDTGLSTEGSVSSRGPATEGSVETRSSPPEEQQHSTLQSQPNSSSSQHQPSMAPTPQQQPPRPQQLPSPQPNTQQPKQTDPQQQPMLPTQRPAEQSGRQQPPMPPLPKQLKQACSQQQPMLPPSTQQPGQPDRQHQSILPPPTQQPEHYGRQQQPMLPLPTQQSERLGPQQQQPMPPLPTQLKQAGPQQPRLPPPTQQPEQPGRQPMPPPLTQQPEQPARQQQPIAPPPTQPEQSGRQQPMPPPPTQPPEQCGPQQQQPMLPPPTQQPEQSGRQQQPMPPPPQPPKQCGQQQQPMLPPPTQQPGHPDRQQSPMPPPLKQQSGQQHVILPSQPPQEIPLPPRLHQPKPMPLSSMPARPQPIPIVQIHQIVPPILPQQQVVPSQPPQRQPAQLQQIPAQPNNPSDVADT